MSARSKFAVDIMYRLWDEHHSCWVRHGTRSLWVLKTQVEKLRDKLIASGRNAAHLSVERVFVEVK